MKNIRSIRQKGETLAAKHLHEQGYHIVDMNFRRNYTEISIICTKENISVFVEVKTRTNSVCGRPFEEITKETINNLQATATYYLSTHPELPQTMRIDMMGVTLGAHDQVEDIEHVENINGR